MRRGPKPYRREGQSLLFLPVFLAGQKLDKLWSGKIAPLLARPSEGGRRIHSIPLLFADASRSLALPHTLGLFLHTATLGEKGDGSNGGGTSCEKGRKRPSRGSSSSSRRRRQIRTAQQGRTHKKKRRGRSLFLLPRNPSPMPRQERHTTPRVFCEAPPPSYLLTNPLPSSPSAHRCSVLPRPPSTFFSSLPFFAK